MRALQLIQPGFDCKCLGFVLQSYSLDTSLQFTDRDRRNIELILAQPLNPSKHATVRFWFTNFGNNISVEQIAVHLNSTRGRRLRPPRAGTRSSKRFSSARSRALRLGRALCSKRRQSSMGTRTAV